MVFLVVYLSLVILFYLIPGDEYLVSKLIPGLEIKEGNSKPASRAPELSGLIMQTSDEPVSDSDFSVLIETPEFIKPTGIELPFASRDILDPFFSKLLRSRQDGSPVKIVHYGDSQLEGDRISKYLRERLQKKFGRGVIVENHSLRGSAGLEFTRPDANLSLGAEQNRAPDLIILQFGINVVPSKSDNFDYYRKALARQVRYINSILPGIPVLIIGVSDMGRLMNGMRAAYNSVAIISEAQRQAASETGSAFYDLLDFMGGPGSFEKWTDYDPPLIRRDLTHFTYVGGALVGYGIAEALSGMAHHFQKAKGHVE